MVPAPCWKGSCAPSEEAGQRNRRIRDCDRRKDQGNARPSRPRRDHPERAGFSEATALTLLAGLPTRAGE